MVVMEDGGDGGGRGGVVLGGRWEAELLQDQADEVRLGRRPPPAASAESIEGE